MTRRAQPPVPRPGWQDSAACRGMDPDLFYDLPPKSTRTPWRVQLVCSACPVRSECLTDALHHRDQFGVWGGTTPLARRALERAQP